MHFGLHDCIRQHFSSLVAYLNGAVVCQNMRKGICSDLKEKLLEGFDLWKNSA
jgi:hypothetical protein